VEFFGEVNIDWMAKKWYFLGFSLIVTVAGVLSMLFWHGIPRGVDFTGGTLITVKFNEPVHEDTIREALHKAGIKDEKVQGIGPAANNEFIISLGQASADERALDKGKESVFNALNASPLAGKYVDRGSSIVGPQVGAQLRNQALLATLYSLAGMLIYLAFRFEFIYGVAAVVAVFHDTIFTLGVFSLTNTELSLTVIAAILTLIGYSMNDTIVVFDRIRENAKIMRRESMRELVNKSINQTLSRTILTSGLTFLTVISLYLFGGEVLHGFSFALVIGILIGTYSSIAVAAPMLVAYQGSRAEKQGRLAESRAAEKRRDKVRA
jgi:preprotein translocase subunit SecF